MRALFFGGAFNPPSIAHIELADYVRRKLHFDKVIFMPSKKTYIKNDEGKDFVFEDDVRLEMLRKIASDREWMEVSDYELSLSEQPRTYHSLCYLKEQTGYELQLLMGSDWLPNLETGWKYIPEIVSEFGIVVMSRNEDNVVDMIAKNDYLKTLHLTVVETPNEFRDVSSTKIRQKFLRLQQMYQELYYDVPEELNGLIQYVSFEESL